MQILTSAASWSRSDIGFWKEAGSKPGDSSRKVEGSNPSVGNNVFPLKLSIKVPLENGVTYYIFLSKQ